MSLAASRGGIKDKESVLDGAEGLVYTVYTIGASSGLGKAVEWVSARHTLDDGQRSGRSLIGPGTASEVR